MKGQRNPRSGVEKESEGGEFDIGFKSGVCVIGIELDRTEWALLPSQTETNRTNVRALICAHASNGKIRPRQLYTSSPPLHVGLVSYLLYRTRPSLLTRY